MICSLMLDNTVKLLQRCHALDIVLFETSIITSKKLESFNVNSISLFAQSCMLCHN